MNRPYHAAWHLQQIIDSHRAAMDDLTELKEFASKYLSYEEEKELMRKLIVFMGAVPSLEIAYGGYGRMNSDEKQLCDDMLRSYHKFQNRFLQEGRKMLSIEEIGWYRREWERLLDRAKFFFQEAQNREWRDFHEHGGIF